MILLCVSYVNRLSIHFLYSIMDEPAFICLLAGKESPYNGGFSFIDGLFWLCGTGDIIIASYWVQRSAQGGSLYFLYGQHLSGLPTLHTYHTHNTPESFSFLVQSLDETYSIELIWIVKPRGFSLLNE